MLKVVNTTPDDAKSAYADLASSATISIVGIFRGSYPLFSLLGSGDNVNIDVFEQAEDLLCQGAFPEGLPA